MQGLQGIKESLTSAQNLQSIVSTMKAHASSNINQFQKAAKASKEYRRILDMSLYIVLSEEDEKLPSDDTYDGNTLHIVFGSDHGLAGPFNERISAYALKKIPHDKHQEVIIVGQQVFQRLKDDFDIDTFFMQAQTTESISSMVNKVLVKIDETRDQTPIDKIVLYYNRPKDNSAFIEETELLFPIDLSALIKDQPKWESNSRPTYFAAKETIISDLIRQYFFITIYRTFCFSLASENASRLASMQAAEKNIEEKLQELNFEYRRERQNSITEELNDIVSGFKAIRGSR